jgi:hypothetical protein
MPKRIRQRYNPREVAVAFICLAPALFLATVFVVIPLINVVYLSFTNWDLLRATKKFIGFSNYQYIFKDEKFLKSMLNTLYFAAVKIPLDLVVSLFIATLLDRKVFARRFLRASYFARWFSPWWRPLSYGFGFTTHRSDRLTRYWGSLESNLSGGCTIPSGRCPRSSSSPCGRGSATIL